MAGVINYGLLDPNAPARVMGSFEEGRQNALARQGAQQANELNALRLKQAGQAMADEETMRQAYAQSGGDIGKVVSGLQQRGMYKPAMELQGQMNAQQLAQRKAHIEEGLQHIDVMGRLAGGVKDQATYDQARAQLAEIFGPEAVANVPPVYDPNAVAQFRNQALSAKDQLEQQWKAADYMLGQQKFAFEKGKFGAEMGLKQKQFGLEQYKASPEYVAGIEGIKAGATAKAKAQVAAKADLPNMEASVQDAITNIDALVGERNAQGKLLKGSAPHPGFQTAVGAGFPGARLIPGTNAADFNARLEQLQGGAFLQAYNTLRGGGQITEIEGKKATAAVTRMSTAQSEKEFIKAAEEFKGVLKRGLENSRKNAGATESEATHPDFPGFSIGR